MHRGTVHRLWTGALQGQVQQHGLTLQAQIDSLEECLGQHRVSHKR